MVKKKAKSTLHKKRRGEWDRIALVVMVKSFVWMHKPSLIYICCWRTRNLAKFAAHAYVACTVSDYNWVEIIEKILPRLDPTDKIGFVHIFFATTRPHGPVIPEHAKNTSQ